MAPSSTTSKTSSTTKSNGSSLVVAGRRRNSNNKQQQRQPHASSSAAAATRRIPVITTVVGVLFLTSFGQLAYYHHYELPDMSTPEDFIRQFQQQQQQQQQQQRHSQGAVIRTGAADQAANGNNNNNNKVVIAPPQQQQQDNIQQQKTQQQKTKKDNPIWDVLRSSGAITDLQDESLPGQIWANMTRLYFAKKRRLRAATGGDNDGPIIVGLETCERYRATVPLEERYAGPAGMFNTGTNALTFHLRRNIPGGDGKKAGDVGNIKRSPWQIPWGKHRLVNLCRNNHTAGGLGGYNHTAAMPVVIIREPFQWMQSMCKDPYSAYWPHGPKHCPNLVPSTDELQRFHARYASFEENTTNGDAATQQQHDHVPVRVVFDKDQKVSWDSLLHLWNDWYEQYVDATYPRLMIRFEDMLIYSETIMQQVARCLGVPPIDQFQYQLSSAKGHGSHSNYIAALLKTADAGRRRTSLTRSDLQYAANYFHDHNRLIDLFSYEVVQQDDTEVKVTTT